MIRTQRAVALDLPHYDVWDHSWSSGTPPDESLRVTFAALDRNVGTIVSECRTIGQTLDRVDEALGVFTDTGDGQGLGAFGLVGLPILAAVRAVRGMAARYVNEQTGTSLDQWTELVADASQSFDTYIHALEGLQNISGQFRTEESRVSADDLETLTDVRWQTQAWKQVLGRVSHLGQVIEAVLNSDVPADEPTDPRDDESAGLSAAFQRFKGVPRWTSDKTDGLSEWVLRPFVEVRDAVQQLPRQVGHVATEVALNEILLELALTQARAQRGDVDPTAARVIGRRVAVEILVPELLQELTETRQRSREIEGNIGRLTRAHSTGRVGQHAYRNLLDEYEHDLAACRGQLKQLQALADGWGQHITSIIDECTKFTQQDLELLAARSIAEEVDTTADRRLLAERELTHLRDVRQLAASLTSPGPP